MTFRPANQSATSPDVAMPSGGRFTFATLFDDRYLSRGLVLYDSLQRHSPGSKLHVLALSAECRRFLIEKKLPDLVIISLDEIEAEQPELLTARGNRSVKEYYYTLSSALCYFMIFRRPGAEVVTYIDADTCFFAPPDVVFEELVGYSVGITEHNFPTWLRKREQYGKYNVGWVSFRRDSAARECLEWWYSKCLEWCCEKVEPKRYADQKYLDEWPKLFRRVRVIKNPGVNCAPWNLAAVKVIFRAGNVYISGHRLVFFHFADLTQISNRIFNTQLGACWVVCHGAIRNGIYIPYLRDLRIKTIDRLDGGLGPRVLGGVFAGLPIKAYSRVFIGLVFGQYVKLPVSERRINFVVSNIGAHSGQFGATQMIHNNLDRAVWYTGFIYTPAFSHSVNVLRGFVAYLVDVAWALLHVLKSLSNRRTVLHLNVGQSRAALVRDSLPFFILLALQRDIRAVVSLHGSNFLHWNKYSSEAIWLRKIVGRSSLLTVLSDRQKEKMIELGVPSSRLFVVPNCSANDGMSPAAIRDKHTEAGPVRILYLSSLIAAKGYRLFLEALKELAVRAGPLVEVCLCGQIAYSNFDPDDNATWHNEKWITQQVEEINQIGRVKLEWIRGADGEQKWNLYRRAQIFVFPSNYIVEAQPLVLIEAMAFGCAIITSKVGEIPSLLPGKCALKLDDLKTATVSAALEALISNPSGRSVLAVAARQLFEQKHTLGLYTKTWSYILKNIWEGSEKLTSFRAT